MQAPCLKQIACTVQVCALTESVCVVLLLQPFFCSSSVVAITCYHGVTTNVQPLDQRYFGMCILYGSNFLPSYMSRIITVHIPNTRYW